MIGTCGAGVHDDFLDAFVEHRRERVRQVVTAVRGGEGSVVDIVRILYTDVRRERHKPARRSVLAHLIKLVDDGLFNDKALLTAAQAIAEAGVFAEAPPLSAWVDKRFLPVSWKK